MPPPESYGSHLPRPKAERAALVAIETICFTEYSLPLSLIANLCRRSFCQFVQAGVSRSSTSKCAMTDFDGFGKNKWQHSLDLRHFDLLKYHSYQANSLDNNGPAMACFT
jgi:hypothetical protein